ncbi:hypothetical protein TD95_004265 [Thielaviopsis punctulata]|uniref:UV radiation resistance-associated gene protein n=1 Tax=Thielaviopsis punctulata TaxID=72032 RepID=A0A0F4Z888_9PEZI|nr:hypothetical protein TD95_004265 [Thielaviopsis punctulata]
MTEACPVLIPENRKLRHLRGIYLRNLTFDPATGSASDDWALTAKGKGKLRAPDASGPPGKLPHARSSDDLVRDVGASAAAAPSLVRRNTGLWTAQAPGTEVTSRHKRLQTAIEARLADVFVTLHCGDDEPIYISETILKRMNFNFQFFDLKHHEPRISRSPLVTVKVWARRQNSAAWIYLLQDQIDLRKLSFLRALENHHFPANTLIFHLSDGAMYTFGAAASPPAKPRQTCTVPTSSYSALMKLSTLETSIHDAHTTYLSLASQIDALLATHPANPVPLARERAEIAAAYLVHQRRSLHVAQRKVHDLRASIAARRAAMAAGRDAQARIDQDRRHATAQLASSRALLQSTRTHIHGQRRRICADLASIFQIAQIPGAAPLAFCIRGVPLPNTAMQLDPSVISSSSSCASRCGKTAREDLLSAGLGFAALLVHMLQFYLGVPLPYPIHAFGSRASIRDDISLLPDLSGAAHTAHADVSSAHTTSASAAAAAAAARTREFPLYLPRGGSTAAQFRFEYAWFLLNKDIEILCAAHGLRLVDIRQTLPNLQYLLYVCAAGADDVPERKRGGVRGLLAGRYPGSSHVGRVSSSTSLSGLGGRRMNTDGGSSRRASVGSEMSSAGRREEDLRRAVARSRTAEREEESDEGGSPGARFTLPFAESETKLTLRTKGMRENVG